MYNIIGKYLNKTLYKVVFMFMCINNKLLIRTNVFEK